MGDSIRGQRDKERVERRVEQAARHEQHEAGLAGAAWPDNEEVFDRGLEELGHLCDAVRQERKSAEGYSVEPAPPLLKKNKRVHRIFCGGIPPKNDFRQVLSGKFRNFNN